ncbi:TetR/AcrR family transcriptional regulator [Nocardioides sp. TRM66260-LWL]|uniref:TetR/AcrR family transcriptional regulator n=1 Tax=Nocardioides sp. TRM66260-LWL TaxID=2874478 RepID=UPI001CC3BEC5|nr:TetR/AcrR family transcriptional regulator [Nocardioides sp. TRM66260-LWL]MBZ5736399.1 TetR/AcrR family transcriptional regulator [Nocardioides sp. TRM66260-LWL]
MPKSWGESVATHRSAVRDAIKDATWSLVHEHGAAGLSMSQIADRVEISRATLYRYFPDVDSILVEWHTDKVHAHVTQLRHAAADVTDPAERLAAVLTCYATIARGVPRGGELATLLHQGAHLEQAEQQVLDLFAEAITSAVEAGAVRGDVAPADLARYCLYALAAPGGSEASGAVLVPVVLAGLQP